MTDGLKKIIWIIGAGSGIGSSLAMTLSKQGHQLILSGRREDRLQSLKSELVGDAIVIPFDITKQEEVKGAYSQIKTELGGLDSIICMSADYRPMAIDKLDLNLCQNILATNLLSAFALLHVVVPDMKLRKSGQIVFCGSVAGYRGLPNAQPYSASKAGLINLAESARLELHPYGIDVKIINPGFVKTDMTDKNDFYMPMMITADVAAERIASQLTNTRRFEIRTHTAFMLIMKILRIMPYWLYFKAFGK